MDKLPPPPASRRVPFLQREDWLISAGLTLVLYFIILIMLHFYVVDGRILKLLVHLLIPLAAVMAWMGLRQRDELMARMRASRAKRRRAEYDLKKQQTETGSAAGVVPDGEEKKK